jgi:hypothetical protein
MPEYDEKKVGRRCIECECNFISRFPWKRCLPCRKSLRTSLRYEIYLKRIPLELRPLVAELLVGNEFLILLIVILLIVFAVVFS